MTVRLPCGHTVVDERQTHYCDYLQLDALAALQPADGDLRHPDERLFLTTHQAFELWFRQMIFDLRRTIDALDADNTALATSLTQRNTRIVGLFTPMLHTLETMTPADFFAFRAVLAPASGSESQQFREVELLAGLRDPAYQRYLQTPLGVGADGNPVDQWTERIRMAWDARSLADALTDLLARRGVTAADLYVVAPAPNPHADLFLLAEALLDFDEAFAEWRYAHARMAERVIGHDTTGTGHTTGVRYLDHAANRPHFFPALWQARNMLA